MSYKNSRPLDQFTHLKSRPYLWELYFFHCEEMKIIINVITQFSFNLRGFFLLFLLLQKVLTYKKKNAKLNYHRK